MSAPDNTQRPGAASAEQDPVAQGLEQLRDIEIALRAAVGLLQQERDQAREDLVRARADLDQIALAQKDDRTDSEVDPIADAYHRGHRAARLTIDRILKDPGKGSMGDLEHTIRQLMSKSDELQLLRENVLTCEECGEPATHLRTTEGDGPYWFCDSTDEQHGPDRYGYEEVIFRFDGPYTPRWRRVPEIARLCHEVNRAYCEALGDKSQVPWEQAPEWQQQSAINGVLFHLEHPNSQPQDSHDNWAREKFAAGWKYGPKKDPEKKEHHCLVPFGQLPIEQRAKDHLFLGVVRALARSCR